MYEKFLLKFILLIGVWMTLVTSFLVGYVIWAIADPKVEFQAFGHPASLAEKCLALLFVLVGLAVGIFMWRVGLLKARKTDAAPEHKS